MTFYSKTKQKKRVSDADFFSVFSDSRLYEQAPLTFENSKDKKLVSIREICRIVRLTAQTFSGLRFYSYQDEVCDAIVQSVLRHGGDVVTILQSRQSGKTSVLSAVILSMTVWFPIFADIFPDDWRFNYTDEQGRYRGFKYGVRVGVYAPTSDQADIPRMRVEEFLNNIDTNLFLKEVGTTWKRRTNGVVELYNSSSKSAIVFRTADPKAKKEGFSYHILFLDEEQDMDKTTVRKSLHPFVATTNGTIFKVGTGSFQICDFYEAIKENKRRQVLPGEPQLHFQFDAERCSRENSLYAQFVARERQRLGLNSDEYQISYNVKFIIERGMLFTEEQLLSPTVAMTDGLFGNLWPQDLRTYDSPFSLIGGLDFGKKMDSTWLTLMLVDWEFPELESHISGRQGQFTYRAYRKHIIAFKEWQGVNWETQIREIKEYLVNFLKTGNKGLADLRVDATSLGDPLYERLCAVLPYPVTPFVFSKERKSDAYKILSSDIISGRTTFPYSEIARQDMSVRRFVQQALDMRKDWESGYMIVRPEVSKYAHDDAVDSVLLANFSGNFPPDTVQIEDINLFKQGGRFHG